MIHPLIFMFFNFYAILIFSCFLCFYFFLHPVPPVQIETQAAPAPLHRLLQDRRSTSFQEYHPLWYQEGGLQAFLVI
ncbi:MAG: hypothetical protein D5R99_02780 [Methanocalculus sp. MSAO_Arc1]|nr:MAG: hypothetical protein D5R99_02780 [Methanocalculus sp. MSAO_Arc1]